MKAPLCFALAALALAMGLFAPATFARNESDAAVVRAVALQQADAWNRHDAVAYSKLFTSDCDVVNIVGWWWKSRAEMQQKLTRAFSSMFRESKLTFTNVQVRFLTPGIAVAHASWKMTGMHMPPGMPPPEAGIQTLVMTKHAGKWRIAVFQNTLSKPEHPFPAAAKPAPVDGTELVRRCTRLCKKAPGIAGGFVLRTVSLAGRNETAQ